MNLLHVVNLSGAGGMEHLFAGYFGACDPREASVFVAAKSHIHPALVALRTGRHRVYSLKRLGPLPVPDMLGLRRRNIRRILGTTAADRVVFWSTLPTRPWEQACAQSRIPMIYYDHGKAWRLPVADARAALRAVARCVTVSRGGARILSERVGYEGPIDVVPNGMRLAVADAAERRPYLDQGRLEIGFAGRLVAKKGLPVLLAAMQSLMRCGIDCRLTIAGDGPGRQRYEDMTRARGLEGVVAFRGNVADMPAFYRHLDVLVAPSLNEPFGLVSIEAAACGAVPVVSGVDGLADTVRDAETGRVIPLRRTIAEYKTLGEVPDDLPEYVFDARVQRLVPPAAPDPEELADALVALARDREGLCAMGQRGAGFAARHFRLDAYARALNGTLAGSGLR